MHSIRTLLSRAVSATPLAYWPVTVRSGPATGAKWTLAPFSHNWRSGGEKDTEVALAVLGEVRRAVCWDFGAHFGIHTVAMAMQIGPEGQVASFEPDPVAFRRLSYHVRINKLNNVRLHQAAVSNRTGTSSLINSHGLGSACSHFQYEDEQVSQATRLVSVRTVVMDELVSSGQVRLPDLIKIDVQGHGAKALQGAMQSVAAKLPIIVFSNHSQWELEGMRALLEPLGYVAMSFAGAPIGWDGLNFESAVCVPSARQRGS
ncbi:MAG: FkbM family methyltransferase [Xanthobacteraceae bacterium]|jgi:FkbM family methyltransferase